MYLHTIAFISVYNLTGWWFQPSEKYEFVSWDDDIPNIWKNKIHVPNHQPDQYITLYMVILGWLPHQ